MRHTHNLPIQLSEVKIIHSTTNRLALGLAAEVNKRGGYALKRYDVARRLVRLNQKLDKETGKLLFEKRGHKWALTGLLSRVGEKARKKSMTLS